MKLKTFEQYLDALRSYFSLLVIFVLLSRSLQVSCCLQVQVIKHRPKQMQKAYPGLLEPGYSYNITSFASNRTQTIKPSKGRRPLCTFLLSAQSLLLQTQQQLQHCAPKHSRHCPVIFTAARIQRINQRQLNSLSLNLCEIKGNNKYRGK